MSRTRVICAAQKSAMRRRRSSSGRSGMDAKNRAALRTPRTPRMTVEKNPTLKVRVRNGDMDAGTGDGGSADDTGA